MHHPSARLDLTATRSSTDTDSLLAGCTLTFPRQKPKYQVSPTFRLYKRPSFDIIDKFLDPSEIEGKVDDGSPRARVAATVDRDNKLV